MKKSCLITLLFLFLICKAWSQDASESLKTYFSIGIKTRVTPIYLPNIPTVISVNESNVQEQPDMHLSGPSLLLSIDKELPKEFILSFSTAIRYDFLYNNLPYNVQNAVELRRKTYKAMVTDLYLDIIKRQQYEKAELRFGAGLALCGIGSGFTQTYRYLNTVSNTSFFVPVQRNFLFPAATASIAWKKNKFLTELKMGYCWSNPTLFKNNFLFPELKAQWQLF